MGSLINKEEFLNDINWVTKQKVAGFKSNADVTVTFSNKKNEKKSNINITFRNNVWELLGDSVKFAIVKNRILFKECPVAQGGYVIGVNNNAANRYLRVPNYTNLPRSVTGDYELHYDTFLELYYVELKES